MAKLRKLGIFRKRLKNSKIFRKTKGIITVMSRKILGVEGVAKFSKQGFWADLTLVIPRNNQTLIDFLFISSPGYSKLLEILLFT